VNTHVPFPEAFENDAISFSQTSVTGAYLPDHPISSLRAAEQFILCAVRLWWNRDGVMRCGRVFLPQGFKAAGLTREDYEQFDALMCILDAAGCHGLAVNIVTQPCLSRDESLILQAIAICQQAHACDAVLPLRRLLPAAAARHALIHASAFADGAARTGLVLPVRPRTSLPAMTPPRVLHA